MNNKYKLIIFLAVSSLFLGSCAPTINGVKDTVSGTTHASYAATAENILATIEELSITVQPSSSHTPYFVENKTADSMVLIARPLGGSAISDSIATAHAGVIRIKINLISKPGYVELSFRPEPSSDVARASQAKLVAKLDERLGRYLAQ